MGGDRIPEIPNEIDDPAANTLLNTLLTLISCKALLTTIVDILALSYVPLIEPYVCVEADTIGVLESAVFGQLVGKPIIIDPLAGTSLATVIVNCA